MSLQEFVHFHLSFWVYWHEVFHNISLLSISIFFESVVMLLLSFLILIIRNFSLHNQTGLRSILFISEIKLLVLFMLFYCFLVFYFCSLFKPAWIFIIVFLLLTLGFTRFSFSVFYGRSWGHWFDKNFSSNTSGLLLWICHV